MAPNYGIATRYGAEAQKETFLMSNVIPQNPIVNRHLWKDLEMRVARRYARYFGEVWVVTGPVFQGKIRRLDSGVPIPSHYYKIIVDEHNSELRALAFLIEERCPPYTRIKTRLVSIDEIEQITDLDFFPDLPDDAEAELESECATRLWPWIGPALRYRLFPGTG
jgi:endonuclease G